MTGVAIGETGDKTSIFFGCYPKWPGLGGAGLIRLYRNWSKKRIFPLKLNGERLIAGSIVVVKDAEQPCAMEDYKPEVCVDMPSDAVLEDEPNKDGASQTKNDNEAPYQADGDAKSEPEPEISTNRTIGNGNDVMTRERTSAADDLHHKIATTVIIMVALIFPEGLDHYF